jgi:hypothetical protein
VFTGFWLGGPKERDHWENVGVGGTLGRNRWGELDSDDSGLRSGGGFL